MFSFNYWLPPSLQLKKLKPLSNIRLSVIGGLIISQLCVLAQSSDLLFIEALSTGIIFALLILVVLVQDLVNTVSIASLFYFWLLFLFSRAPLVPLIHNDDGIKEVVCIIHFVSFILALFGFVLECFPIKFDEQAPVTTRSQVFPWKHFALWVAQPSVSERA